MTDRPAYIEGVKDTLRRYEQAIGPGGDKAWLAGQLAAQVPALLTDVERLARRCATRHEETEQLRAELARVRAQVAAEIAEAIEAEANDEAQRLRRGPVSEAIEGWLREAADIARRHTTDDHQKTKP